MKALYVLLALVSLCSCRPYSELDFLKTRCNEPLRCRVPFSVAMSRAEVLDGRRIQIIGVVRSTQGGKLLLNLSSFTR
jgi:hypothetical protein